VLALCVMVIATRSRLRTLWLVGAALMGVVVVKLFLWNFRAWAAWSASSRSSWSGC
jgi:uncharacterized membrane protein